MYPARQTRTKRTTRLRLLRLWTPRWKERVWTFNLPLIVFSFTLRCEFKPFHSSGECLRRDGLLVKRRGRNLRLVPEQCLTDCQISVVRFDDRCRGTTTARVKRLPAGS